MQERDKREKAEKKYSSNHVAASRVTKIGAVGGREEVDGGETNGAEDRALFEFTAEVPIPIGPETIHEERRDEDADRSPDPGKDK